MLPLILFLAVAALILILLVIFKPFKEAIVTQFDLINQFSQALQRAPVYRKFGAIQARQVTNDNGEDVVTITSSGHETNNHANWGDWIITNPGGEEYAISDAKFSKRYEHVIADDYMPIGLIKAVLYTGAKIKIEAPWGSTQPVNNGDFLCTTYEKDDHLSLHTVSEIYRIDREEFFQTYKLHSIKTT